uniref:Uncharacterized protein n=1 Tax=Dicentrarchus labrax TaxID=13489 RepID=A0A8P4JX71_DICLA
WGIKAAWNIAPSHTHTCCDWSGCSHRSRYEDNSHSGLDVYFSRLPVGRVLSCTEGNAHQTLTFSIGLLLLTLSPQLSSLSPQLNVHWGPQSMMYLKGKHGRRFVTEDDSSVLKQGLQGLYAVLRGIQKQSWGFSKPGHIVRSDKVLIHYLQER